MKNAIPIAEIVNSPFWWTEVPATRIVWLTLLLVADDDGFAYMGTVANLARRANVTEMEAKCAVDRLEHRAPLPPLIDRVAGGWMVYKVGAL